MLAFSLLCGMLFVLVLRALFSPGSFGEWIGRIRKGYDKEMRKP